MGCKNSSDNKKRQVPNDLNVGQKKKSKQMEAKIILIGESSVGKTSIAQRYQHGKFDPNERATAGAAFFEKVVQF